ncbi:hypothetical protein AB4455_03540 [Vibrio sp. 10N.261.46.E12]|nr:MULTISPECIES: hypothetical protein [unclassified Vibrio]OMO38347.1 hypothetical protein BH584_01650 [Vibrio sp. 10N.261.45.E1]PMJ19528.1 hypothetical protein BCU27_21545 [Vibrio sp. 10N.286.45.B6]PML84274.1 hypothetical protein BCT66_17760 [Vibrio sp. 10N.261.49.E11]PMM79802.1 hypothetical protein BCT46_19615 [Vibrio sp. 10N.261.46.E8]PMN47538.1 hypothetical protein BCT32_09525 [Vibrio sp. 10N.261.45.E11]
MTYRLLDFSELFLATHQRTGQNTKYHSEDKANVVVGINDLRCNPNGYNKSRIGSIRTQSFLGLLVVFNGQSIKQIKSYLNARSTAGVLKQIEELRQEWLVDVSVRSGYVYLESMGPILNPNPHALIQIAFPSGKILLKSRLYKLH